LEKQQGKLALKPTMQKGNAEDLQALIDHDLLTRLLDDSLAYMPIDGGNGKSWLQRFRDRL
jgi:hypothetical protein